jgi:FtsZ-binding cell division protein ZapB
MPDTVKSLKLENEELKTQVNMLRKEFKNLEVTLERRIAQSNDT